MTGWQDKVKRCTDGDQTWGLFIARTFYVGARRKRSEYKSYILNNFKSLYKIYKIKWYKQVVTKWVCISYYFFIKKKKEK